MSFERPTLSDLIEQTQTDFEARLPGADARVHNSLVNVLARVHAGALHGLYGYLDSIRDNAFLIDPDDEYLELMASRWGISRQANNYDGGFAYFFAQDGLTIPKGYLLQDKNGRNYATIQTGLAVANRSNYYPTPQLVVDDPTLGWVVIPIKALEVGKANIAVDEQFTVMHPIAGGGSTAIAYGAFYGGDEIESNDDLKERLIDRMRRPPMGGTIRDYERWVLGAHSDISRVWVFPNYQSQVGNVTIFMAGDIEGVGPGVLGTHHFDAVEVAIAEKAPILANVDVLPVEKAKLPLKITDYQSTLQTDDARDQIKQTIIDFLFREATPGEAIKIGKLREALSATPGMISHNLVTPAADIQASDGKILVLGNILWE